MGKVIFQRSLQAVVLVFFALVSHMASAQETFALKNKWKESFLTAQGGNVLLTGQLGGRGTVWQSVPTGDGYVTIRSDDGLFLFFEDGRLQVGASNPAYQGAHWRTFPVGDGTFRIGNRLENTFFLHAEYDQITVSNIEDGWWSAMWLVEPFQTAEGTAGTPQDTLNRTGQQAQTQQAQAPQQNTQTQQAATQDIKYYVLRNVWKQQLFSSANQQLGLAASHTDQGAIWAIGSAPDNYITLSTLSGEALYIDQGALRTGPFNLGDPAAQWLTVPVGDGSFRLQNRAQPNLFLHAEHAMPEVGPAEADWLSARWQFGEMAADAVAAIYQQNQQLAAGNPPAGGSVSLQIYNGAGVQVAVVAITADGQQALVQYLEPGASMAYPTDPAQILAFAAGDQWVGSQYVVTSDANQQITLPYAPPAPPAPVAENNQNGQQVPENQGPAQTASLTNEQITDIANQIIGQVVKTQLDAQNKPMACWKDTIPRGAGTIPECGPNQERDGLLCYPKCSSHASAQPRQQYDNVAGVCWQRCPAGFRNDGAFCRKAEYGRGAGFGVIPFKEWDDSAAFKRCEASEWKNRNKSGYEHISSRGYGRNCEKNGLIVYPKCKPGYKNVGCCICAPIENSCEAAGLGGKFLGSCAKKSFVVWPEAGQCARRDVNGNVVDASSPNYSSAIEYENDAGLCYKNCDQAQFEKTGLYNKGKYTGVGPVCWAQCPAGMVNCGASCAKDKQSCAMTIGDQVTSPLIAAGGAALTVVTLGASTGATTAAKVGGAGAKIAAKAAARASAKASIKAAVKVALKSKVRRLGQELLKDFALDTAISSAITTPMWAGFSIKAQNDMKDAVSDSVRAKLNEITSDDAAIDAVVELTLKGVEKQSPAAEFPWESLDPTGIAEVVVAYNLPLCSSIE